MKGLRGSDLTEKIATGIFLALLLASVLMSPFNILQAELGEIYIREDGGVEDTDRIKRVGNLYTFTGNIFDSIVVKRSNIASEEVVKRKVI